MYVLLMIGLLFVPQPARAQEKKAITFASPYPECGDRVAASYFYLTMADYEDAVVTEVVDGRTLEARLRTGKVVRVRIAGLKPIRSEVSDSTGAQSYLRTLVEGERVDVLEYGYDAATFGTLAEVEARIVSRGKGDVAAAMLTAGMADIEDTRHLGHIEQCEYRHIAADAQREQRGLWGRRDREQRPN
jgi:endonuclease YncB( thermonuclease family)